MAFAALSGAAMIGTSVAWFVVARTFAIRQTSIAEELLVQQHDEQRAATTAMVAASRSSRAGRSSRSSRSSTSSASVSLLDSAEPAEAGAAAAAEPSPLGTAAGA